MSVAATPTSPTLYVEGLDRQRDHSGSDRELIGLINSNLSARRNSIEAQQRETQGTYSPSRLINSIFFSGGGVHLILASFCSLYLATSTLFSIKLLAISLFYRLTSGAISTLCGAIYIIRGIRAWNRGHKLEGCYRCFAGFLMVVIGVLTVMTPPLIKYAATSAIIMAFTHPMILPVLCAMLALCILGELTYQFYCTSKVDSLGDQLMLDLKTANQSQKYVLMLNHCLSTVMEGGPAAEAPLEKLRRWSRNGRQMEVGRAIHAMIDQVEKRVTTQTAIEICQFMVDLSSLSSDLEVTQEDSEQSQVVDLQGQGRGSDVEQSRIGAQQDLLQKALNKWKMTRYARVVQYLCYILSMTLPLATFYLTSIVFILSVLSKSFAILTMILAFLQ